MKRFVLIAAILLAALVLPPAAIVWTAAVSSHQTVPDYVRGALDRLNREERTLKSLGEAAFEAPEGPALEGLEARPIGAALTPRRPEITHLEEADLDGDGRVELLASDISASAVVRLSAIDGSASFTQTVVTDFMRAPGRVRPVDLDGDGDEDLVVAELGDLYMSRDREGGAVALENAGGGVFATTQTLTHIVPRVTDLRPADLDGDGDLDIVQASANLVEGGVSWIENEGDWRFTTHSLVTLSPVLDAPAGDLDGDGDVDIAAVLCRDEQKVLVLENDGAGNFESRLAYEATNKAFHAGALELQDLDGDGDLDMLLTNGDSRGSVRRPRPWHGVQWLENRGDLEFEFHRIGALPGASRSVAFDYDDDGDLDIFTVACLANWREPATLAFVCYENQGDMRFVRRTIAREPTHPRTVLAVDLNGDGRRELVTGGLALNQPVRSAGRIVLWEGEPSPPAADASGD